MVPAHHEKGTQITELFRQEIKPLITDAELLICQTFQADVRRGYELLFRRYYQVLCSQAVRFVYSREVAQDIVSEIFLNFWKNEVHQHITTSYRAYLFTAVRNRALSHLQDEFQREVSLGNQAGIYDHPASEDDPQQLLQFAELSNRVEVEIRQLSPQCQRVFLMSRFEGKKNREIADELRISTKTVEAHMFKALMLLRKALQASLLAFTAFWLLSEG